MGKLRSIEVKTLAHSQSERGSAVEVGPGVRRGPAEEVKDVRDKLWIAHRA